MVVWTKVKIVMEHYLGIQIFQMESAVIILADTTTAMSYFKIGDSCTQDCKCESGLCKEGKYTSV